MSIQREGPYLRIQGLLKETSDCVGNGLCIGFQGEVACLQESHFGLRVVSGEGFGPCRQEDRIVAPPDGEERGLPGAKVGLKGRIEGNVGAVVEEEIELRLPGQRWLSVLL